MGDCLKSVIVRIRTYNVKRTDVLESRNLAVIPKENLKLLSQNCSPQKLSNLPVSCHTVTIYDHTQSLGDSVSQTVTSFTDYN